MLLQQCHFSPLYPSLPCTPLPPSFFSLVHVHGSYICSLASPFLILFLTSPCVFCTYLCFLFPVPFPPFFPLLLPTDNTPCDLYFCESVPVLVVCLVHFCFQVQLLIVVCCHFLKRFYLFIFRQKGREGERKGEKHQWVVASHVPSPTGDLAHNPGVCPGWESNQRPFGSQVGAQYAKPHQPGLLSF